MTPKNWDRLRRAISEALDETALTRDELATAISRERGLGHLGDALRSGWGTLLKPLAWQGDLCFGPSHGNRITFMRPDAASSRWAGIRDADQAAPAAIVAYLRAYAPATVDAFANWLSGGWFGKRKIRVWANALANCVAEVDVDGERVYVLVEDLDQLVAARPTDTVRLLPAFDQYVLGAGTADAHVVPQSRRPHIKQSGWIAPVVVAGGAVSGTWRLQGDEVRVAWFSEAGKPPRRALKAEVVRLASILDRELRLVVALL
jgi:hypothetical protein